MVEDVADAGCGTRLEKRRMFFCRNASVKAHKLDSQSKDMAEDVDCVECWPHHEKQSMIFREFALLVARDSQSDSQSKEMVEDMDGAGCWPHPDKLP